LAQKTSLISGEKEGDRNYETIRMAMQSVFQELGLAA
jgi:hypothetical protein